MALHPLAPAPTHLTTTTATTRLLRVLRWLGAGFALALGNHPMPIEPRGAARTDSPLLLRYMSEAYFLPEMREFSTRHTAYNKHDTGWAKAPPTRPATRAHEHTARGVAP